jgi:hypothetical protein
MIDLVSLSQNLTPQFSWATLSWHIVIAYGISWLYFFFTVRFFTSIFGNIFGTAFNYGISWILMIAAVFALQKLKTIQSNLITLAPF